MKFTSTLIGLAALMLTGAASADLMIYPANGQDSAQQQSDEGECFVWARNETGIDPMAQQATAPTSTQQQSGGGVGGALKGAAIGGIVDGSDGAKTGAAVGVLAGRSRQNRHNRHAQQQQQAQAEQAQAVNAQNKATFDRAYGVCLQGRGYTVS
ncbi:MAG: hypothetical protein ABGY96_26210 [bacterium]|nr:hypothetical protein [Gammaproteobacteria bacterium]HIL94841.1 hypothetical protein [Pseudomonadales bacterium]